MAFPWLAARRAGRAQVRRLYLFWSDNPTAFVDTSGTVGRKLDALRCHESQRKDFASVEKWTANGPRSSGSGSAWTAATASTSS